MWFMVHRIQKQEPVAVCCAFRPIKKSIITQELRRVFWSGHAQKNCAIFSGNAGKDQNYERKCRTSQQEG